MIYESSQPIRTFKFGPFALMPERQVLLQDGQPVRIGARALDILTALVERPGELIDKRFLMARVWPDVVVEESNLKVNMAALRRALGDGAGNTAASFIATVTGRGYRFVAAVESVGLSASAASPPQPSPVRHNLPFCTTRIHGRNEVIESLAGEMDQARLVTIVGPGGVGKTTVALAVAERSFGRFPDGVWLVDFSTVSLPEYVPDAIAAVIGAGCTAPDGTTAPWGPLRARRALLVLDSCEHLVEAIADCAQHLLTCAPGVHILATSREPLMVSLERVRRLPGLSSPPEGATVGAEAALKYPAVQVFAERASDRSADFRLSDADARLVGDICRRLDGVALAIELAATRTDIYGISGLHARLDDRFSVLAERRAGPERQRTLAATIAWSFGLLSTAQAAFLRSLAVFNGTFDADGAQAVNAVARTEALANLDLLVDKSLVSSEMAGERVLYRLMNMTRSFCLERLTESGDEAVVRRRHAEHLCAVLESARSAWALLPAGEWAPSYGRLMDDLRGALEWASRDATNRPLQVRLTLAGIPCR